MDLGLAGCNAVVTGGSRGIGRAVVQTLLREAASVLVVARGQGDLAPLEQLDLPAETRVVTCRADLSVDDDILRVAEAIHREFSSIQVLVNCACASTPARLTSSSQHLELDGHQKASVYLKTVRACLPEFRGGPGAVVHLVGNDGVRPLPWNLPAVANNAALIALTRAMAYELAPQRIRVNAVNPGPTRTERWDRLVAHFASEWEIERDVVASMMVDSLYHGRLIEPDEVAHLVVFLCSRLSESINGESITIDALQRRDQFTRLPVATKV